jgi:hypothetical protein
MRNYQVWMKDSLNAPNPVEVRADDVEVNSEGNAVFWNFIAFGDDKDNVTVAAFPFGAVAFTVSK